MKEWIVKIIKKPIFIVLLSLAVFFSFAIGGTIAAYREKQETKAAITAEPFAFTSDYLTETGNTYQVQASSVDFVLKNSDGLTVTKSELTYTLTVTAGGSLNTQSGSLTGNAKNTNTHTLTNDNIDAGENSVTVTATSTAPYAKTLSATFVFVDQRASYQIFDQGDYIILELCTGTTIPDIGYTIIYDGNFVADNSNPLTKTWTDTTIGTLEKAKLAPNSRYELIFFKTDTADFNKDWSTAQQSSIANHTIDLTSENENYVLWNL